MPKNLHTAASAVSTLIQHFPETAEAILQQHALSCPIHDLQRGREMHSHALIPAHNEPIGVLLGWLISYISACRNNPKTAAFTQAPIRRIIRAIGKQIPTANCSTCGKKIPRYMRLMGWPINGSCPDCAAGPLDYCHCGTPLPPSIYFTRCTACARKSLTKPNSFSRSINIILKTINEHIHSHSDPLFAAAILEAGACALRATWHHYHNQPEPTAENIHKLDNIAWMLLTRFSIKSNLHKEWHSRIIGPIKEEA